MAEVINGPLWAARNWSADAGSGSIHDDETAQNLGFRGGTVAGDVHMNQFVPVLLKVFGNDWFERGNISLLFRNATVDREQVQVFAEQLNEGTNQCRVWMEREDGLLVCEGTAAMGDHSASILRNRDLRGCDPAELKILNRLYPGLSLGTYEVTTTTDTQFHRFDTGVISDPLDWYRSAEESPWQEIIAAPATLLEYLWAWPMKGLMPLVGESVGLFGAIEIGFEQGPFLFDRNYRIESEVVEVGQSPQTEFVWYDSVAYDREDRVIARMRMQSRAMKSSSPAYQ